MGTEQAPGNSATETVASAHAHLRARTDIQFDMTPAKPAETPEWVKWLARLLEPLAPLAGWIFWGLVIAGVATILYLIARSLIRKRGQSDAASDEQEVDSWRPEAKVARALLAEADAMAAAGRFEEAARLLLHRSLEDIARNRPRLLQPALTSREISVIAGLPQLVRNAFAAMAAPVERSLFAGRSLEARDWQEARAAYGAFALPGAWK